MLITGVTFPPSHARAQCGDKAVMAEQTKILALTFHADYCGPWQDADITRDSFYIYCSGKAWAKV